MTQPSHSALSKQNVHTAQWEDQHELGHQRWLLCHVRICPEYDEYVSGGMC